MERRWLQAPTSRDTSKASPTQDNTQEMVQDMGGGSMDSQVEDRRKAEQHTDTPLPNQKVLQLHEGLSKRESALLVQLRTEKIGLRDFLFS